MLIADSFSHFVQYGKETNVNNLPVHEYTLTIKEEMVNKAGKDVKGMTVNGTFPDLLWNLPKANLPSFT